MVEALLGSLIGTVVGALIALAGTWLVVRDSRKAREDEIRNKAMAEMVALLHRGTLPREAAWDERARFAERFTLALLQISDAGLRKRMQDSVDLIAFAARNEHHLQDFTDASEYQIEHLARTDLRLCLANRNERSVPAPAKAWDQEVHNFRNFEDYIEDEIRRQEEGPDVYQR